MEDSATDSPGHDPGVGPGRAPVTRTRSLLRPVLFAIGLALIVAAGVIYWRSTAWESTDNAQIDGFVFPVSARVSGHVLRVMVDDNQYVQAGTVLVQLDPKDYEVAVAIAQGELANNQAAAAALLTGVPIASTDTASQIAISQADIDGTKAGFAAAQRQFEAAQASLRQAEANDLKAQDDLARYKPLAAKDEIPQQQVHVGREQPAGHGRSGRGRSCVGGGSRRSGDASPRPDRPGPGRARIRSYRSATGLGPTFSCPRRRGRDRAIDGATAAGAVESAGTRRSSRRSPGSSGGDRFSQVRTSRQVNSC